MHVKHVEDFMHVSDVGASHEIIFDLEIVYVVGLRMIIVRYLR